MHTVKWLVLLHSLSWKKKYHMSFQIPVTLSEQERAIYQEHMALPNVLLYHYLI